MKHIAIFGAGAFGEYIYNVLKKENDKKIVCFVDNRGKALERIIPVWTVEKLQRELSTIDQIWLAVSNYYDMGDIVFQLHDIGVNEIWVVKPELWNRKLSFCSVNEIENEYVYYLDISKKAVISKLEFHVCDICNLNCKGCSHFAPVFERREGGYVTTDNFAKQAGLLSQKFANIFRFRLMGGEPFLHKNLDAFVEMSRKALPYTHLEIVTNGLILQKVPEYIWSSIRKNRAVLNISLYPPTFNIKNELEEFLSEKEIEYSFGSGLEQYNEYGIIEEFHKCFTEYKIHDPQISSKQCMGSKCHYLREGRISKCALPLLSKYLNEYYGKNYMVEARDFVCLEDDGISPWEMVNILENATPFCAYCTEGKPERFLWEVGKHQFADYVITE